MGVRLTGLNSGMDTESMIKKIMDAQRTKLNKIEGKRTTLDWKKDKWKVVFSLHQQSFFAQIFKCLYNQKSYKFR